MTAPASAGDTPVWIPTDDQNTGPIPMHRRLVPTRGPLSDAGHQDALPDETSGLAETRPSDGASGDLGFDVPAQILIQNGRAPLEIFLDPSRYDGIRIFGLPEGVQLSRGEPLSESSVLIAPLELSGLSLRTCESRTNQDFLLSVTPIRRRTLLRNLTRHVNIRFRPLSESSPSLWIPSFGIVAGNSGPMPMERPAGSTQCSLVIKGLPPFVALSAGEQIGDEWFLNHRQLAGLQIHAMRSDDPYGWKPYYNFLYRAHPVAYAVEAESTCGQVVIDKRNFVLYTFQM